MVKRIKQYFLHSYQSLIFRVLLYFVISALAVAIVLGWNFASRIKPHFENEILPNLSQYLQYLVQDIASPPDLEKARSLTDRLQFELRIEGSGVEWSSTTRLQPIDSYRFKAAPYPYQKYSISHQDRDHLLLLETAQYRYLFSVNNSFKSGSVHRHRLLFFLLAGILLVLYLASRRLFSPVSDISQHVKQIGEGRLDQSIEVNGNDELARLARGINAMTVEIKSMLEGKAGLLLAISHELRSPITRMRINLELLDDDEKRRVLVQDLQEMEELVSTILESERLNTRHACLNRSCFDMAEVVREVIEQQFETCFISKNLSSVKVNFDEVRMKLLVKNIIENACRHSSDSNQAVEVKLGLEEKMLIFSVSDYGPGVEARDLEHLTEPFYRADSARLRNTGGYGLGLYLCRLIVEAHGGKLELASELGQGMNVTVRIPIIE